MASNTEDRPVPKRRKRGRMGGEPLISRDAMRDKYWEFADEHGTEHHKTRGLILEHSKQAWADAHTEAKRRLETGEADGIGVARLLGLAMDAIIAALSDFVVGGVYRVTNPTKAERLGIVAVGGYGRGELAPQSDIDLLFLLPYKKTAWSESVAEWLLYMLWDLGVTVGHSTRSIDECVRQAQADVTIATAMLEARAIWGDDELIAEFDQTFWNDVVGKGPASNFVDAKLAERDERHQRVGDSRYKVEPNIKEGKGGLRDLQTLYWIGKWVYRVDSAAGLVKEEVLTRAEARRFAKAEAFFMTVRCHIHFMTGRAEERVTFDLQPALAEKLGYTDRAGSRGVERFMRHYFLCTKDVGDLTRIFCAVLEETSHKQKPNSFGRFLPRFRKKQQEIGDFMADNGRINIVDEDVFEKDPVNILRLFQEADAHDFDIHPEALQHATRSLKLIDKKLRRDPVANEVFLETLASRHDPKIALRRLNEAGVMGKFMPEFGRVVALMQFNMYHHYTVDEHTIHAIGVLAAIERGEKKDTHTLGTKIIHQIVSRRALYVGMLMHDIAKGLPGDHSEVGADIALKVCPRLGLTPEETETVAWLVRMHLVMSNVAQKRDISDPKTVETFAEIVQSPERLRLLHCLTEADMEATAEGVWNDWKAQLMRELYESTLDRLTAGQSAQGRNQRIESAIARFEDELPEWTQDQRDAFINRQFGTYWLGCDTGAQVHHAGLMAQYVGEQNSGAQGGMVVDWRVVEERGVTEVTLVMPDHPGIFARVAGVLSLAGANIVDAKGFTTKDGVAIDVFSVQDDHGAPFDDASRLDRLHGKIEKVLHGDVNMPSELQSRGRVPKRVRPFTVEPRVLIDNNASDTFTIVEVNGLDRLGLLYDLGRVFYGQNLTLGSAHISTYGERVVDVFYVKDLFGHKITHKQKLTAMERRLKEVLARDFGSSKNNPDPANPTKAA